MKKLTLYKTDLSYSQYIIIRFFLYIPIFIDDEFRVLIRLRNTSSTLILRILGSKWNLVLDTIRKRNDGSSISSEINRSHKNKSIKI